MPKFTLLYITIGTFIYGLGTKNISNPILVFENYIAHRQQWIVVWKVDGKPNKLNQKDVLGE